MERPEPSTIPDTPGSYQFKDARGRVLYVGKAKSLRSRVMSLLRAGAPGAHAPDGGRRRHGRVDRRPQRGRGALPRVQPHQEAPAALQHPAQGRQVVPVPRGHARRGVAAGDGAARREAQGRALLRPVRARVRDPRDARPPAAHVPDPHVHEGQVRPPPPPRPAVPLRAHREVRGAVRRGGRRPRSTRASSRSCSTSSTARPRRSSTGSTSRCTRRADELEFERAARLRDQLVSVRKAIERQQMVDAKEEDFDVIGIVEDALEASVQVFFVRKGRVVGRKGSSSTRSRTSTPPELVGRLLEQLYGGADPGDIPREILVPHEPEDLALYEEFLGAARRAEGAPPRAAARREARAAGDGHPERRGGVRAPQAAPRVRPQRPRPRAARAAGRAAPAGGAAAHRVLRHLEPAGHRDRRVDGRDGGRARRSAPTTAASRSATSRARTTSPRWRRC